VLLEGLDATITKTATLVPESLDEEVHIIRPLQFHTQVMCRVLLSYTL
jgi:116 kDa U5 small nuclear ribonucleoprotein component